MTREKGGTEQKGARREKARKGLRRPPAAGPLYVLLLEGLSKPSQHQNSPKLWKLSFLIPWQSLQIPLLFHWWVSWLMLIRSVCLKSLGSQIPKIELWMPYHLSHKDTKYKYMDAIWNFLNDSSLVGPKMVKTSADLMTQGQPVRSIESLYSN